MRLLLDARYDVRMGLFLATMLGLWMAKPLGAIGSDDETEDATSLHTVSSAKSASSHEVDVSEKPSTEGLGEAAGSDSLTSRLLSEDQKLWTWDRSKIDATFSEAVSTLLDEPGLVSKIRQVHLSGERDLVDQKDLAAGTEKESYRLHSQEALANLLSFAKGLERLEVWDLSMTKGFFSFSLSSNLVYLNLSNTLTYHDPLFLGQLSYLGLKTLIVSGRWAYQDKQDVSSKYSSPFCIDALSFPPQARLSKSLKTLDVSYQGFDHWESIQDIVKNFSTLEHIYLTGASWRSYKGVRPLEVGPLSSESLKLAALNLEYVRQASMTQIIAGLPNLENLLVKPYQTDMPEKEIRFLSIKDPGDVTTFSTPGEVRLAKISLAS